MIAKPQAHQMFVWPAMPLSPRGPLVMLWVLLAMTRTTSPNPRVTMAR